MKNNCWILLCAALCIALTGTASATPVLSISPAEIDLSGGERATVTLMLSGSSGGVDGYEVSLGLSDPATGTFTSVSYPEWASLNTTSGLSSGSLTVKAIDVWGTIQDNATSIPLCTITVQGEGSGSSDILLKVVRMEADKKPVTPDVQNGRLTVSGGVLPETTVIPGDTAIPGIATKPGGTMPGRGTAGQLSGYGTGSPDNAGPAGDPAGDGLPGNQNPGNLEIPLTGSVSPVFLVIGILCIAGAAVAAILVARKKE